MRMRRARPGDVAGICRLIADYAGQGLLLPRTADDVRAHLGRFLVLTERVCAERWPAETTRGAEKLLACVALEPYGADLAEIRSLAVNPEAQGRGLGGRLVEAALRMARRRKIARVFAVTHAADFFERHGFVMAPRQAVPEKIARDCRSCSKARDCELVAVVAVVCADRFVLPVLAGAGKAAATL
jgi:amino-acid N-acetyltransferase